MKKSSWWWWWWVVLEFHFSVQLKPKPSWTIGQGQANDWSWLVPSDLRGPELPKLANWISIQSHLNYLSKYMVVENKIIWVRHISFIGNFILFCRFLCCPFTLYRIDSVLNTCGFISVFRRKIGLQIRHLVVKLHTQHQQNRITSQWYVREESQNLLGEP